jgi:hypothetical protein
MYVPNLMASAATIVKAMRMLGVKMCLQPAITLLSPDDHLRSNNGEGPGDSGAHQAHLVGQHGAGAESRQFHADLFTGN